MSSQRIIPFQMHDIRVIVRYGAPLTRSDALEEAIYRVEGYRTAVDVTMSGRRIIPFQMHDTCNCTVRGSSDKIRRSGGIHRPSGWLSLSRRCQADVLFRFKCTICCFVLFRAAATRAAAAPELNTAGPSPPSSVAQPSSGARCIDLRYSYTQDTLKIEKVRQTANKWLRDVVASQTG